MPARAVPSTAKSRAASSRNSSSWTLCARELGCDGVVLDVRHFPRQTTTTSRRSRRWLTDWGLSIAALSDSSFFISEPERVTKVLSDAVFLGAPLVAAPLALQTEFSWSEQLERCLATSLAKRLNVTLLAKRPNTFAAGTQDCKRVVKETDSAWLRYGPDPQELDAASDAQPLATNTVLLWSGVRKQTEQTVAAATHAFAIFADTLPSTRLRGGNDGAACGRDRYVARSAMRPIQRTQPQIASCVRGTNLHSRRWVRPGRRFGAGISSPPLRRIRS